MPQTDAPENVATPEITIAAVRARTRQTLALGISSLLPLTGMAAALATGYAYVVGVYSYKFWLDFNGIPLSAIEPSLTLILLRGAQASVPMGLVFAMVLVAVAVGLYFLLEYLLTRAEVRRLQLVAELSADPALAETGSVFRRKMRRDLLKLSQTGWKPNVDVAVRSISSSTLFFTIVFVMFFEMPAFIFAASLTGYLSGATFGEKMPTGLFFPQTVGVTFEYTTAKGVYCGLMISEGTKGVAVLTATGVVILHTDDISQIRRCALPQS